MQALRVMIGNPVKDLTADGDLILVIWHNEWWLECTRHTNYASETHVVDGGGTQEVPSALQINFRVIQEEALKHVMEHVKEGL